MYNKTWHGTEELNPLLTLLEGVIMPYELARPIHIFQVNWTDTLHSVSEQSTGLPDCLEIQITSYRGGTRIL